MSEFEWMEEVVPYYTPQPKTIYHFDPPLEDEEYDELLSQINPLCTDVISWIVGVRHRITRGKQKPMKYFTVDSTLKVIGWCDTTNIDVVLRYYPDFSVVEVRDVINLPLSRPIVPNQG